MPHVRALIHDFEKRFVEIWRIEIVPAVSKCILDDNIIRRGTEEHLRIDWFAGLSTFRENDKDFLEATLQDRLQPSDTLLGEEWI